MLVRNRESVAYDFALFEEGVREEKEPKIKRAARTLERYSPSRRGNVFGIILMAALAVMLPIYFLSSKVELSELTGKINAAQFELEYAQNENLRLQAELDNIVTLSRVEDFAQNVLGMQRITTAQGTHISLNTGGTTEIAQDLDNPVTFISQWFSDVLEYLGFR
jgi:cell division protein FtsL